MPQASMAKGRLDLQLGKMPQASMAKGRLALQLGNPVLQAQSLKRRKDLWQKGDWLVAIVRNFCYELNEVKTLANL